jgi:hypothetical protein
VNRQTPHPVRRIADCIPASAKPRRRLNAIINMPAKLP